MKAIVYYRHGGPEVLEYQDIPAPVPADKEVLIRVQAAALNPLDWRLMRAPAIVARLVGLSTFGKFSMPGVDVAGVVEAVGGAVTQFKPGDEVFGAGKGSCAELACAGEDKIALKPGELGFEQAAAIPIGGLTALQALRDHAHLQPGQKLLVNGAAGGVGVFAVQLGRWLGAEVTGVCSSGKLEFVLSLGAHHVIDYTRDDFTRGPLHYDCIFDLVGHRSLNACLHALTPKGFYVAAAPPKGLLRMFVRIPAIRVMPLLVSQEAKFFSARVRHDDLQLIARLMAEGRIVSVTDRTVPLAETADAMRYLELGHARGKVIIVPGQTAEAQSTRG
jgi:NADPH:quinone reductase-like Zn-dependent oxidoreductase